MTIAKLFWKLLRYRVAVMLILFMLVSIAIHEPLSKHALKLLIGAMALAFTYVSATSSNDLADEQIDKINHANSPGRPLISGHAKRTDMWQIFSISSVIAVLLSTYISPLAVLIVGFSVLVNIAYSLPPLRLSYRTFLAPLILGIGYVGVPYLLGVAITNKTLNKNDALWLIALYTMFIGRIILKDFRDRKGDTKYNKPTFLLKYGKNATCAVSIAAILSGGLLLVFQTRHILFLAAFILVYILAIILMIARLQKSQVGKEEQLSIGVGAKMGNGLLITILSVYALRENAVPESIQLLVTVILAALFLGNYLSFLQNPQAARLGYKG